MVSGLATPDLVRSFFLQQTLENEMCIAPPGFLLLFVCQPLGSLIEPTLLADWLAISLISWALSGTSSVPPQ